MTTVATPPSSSAWEEIRAGFFQTGDAAAVLARRTAGVDRVVLSAYEEFLLPSLPKGFGLIAVGGYGRLQLFPYSDVDLLLLFESDRLAEQARPAIGAFLQRLWDAELRVSQSVRTPAECLEIHDRNVELNISLLDRRYLAGDGGLFGASYACVGAVSKVLPVDLRIPGCPPEPAAPPRHPSGSRDTSP